MEEPIVKNQMMEKGSCDVSIQQLKRELRMTRIFCVISSLLTGGLLLGAIILVIALQPAFTLLGDVAPMLEQASTLDVEQLNVTLENVNSMMGSVDWQQVAESLNQLDVDAINTALEGLDMEELSAAIENLNKITGTLEGMGETFQSFGGLFGR